MNKTISININGIIFHIDEDAHHLLQEYLNKLKTCFNEADGRDEIMNDIEARIAEMFQENKTKLKEVLTIKDVKHIINTMGQPEDFMDDGTEKNIHNNEDREEPINQNSNKRRRVFRNPDNKVVGGVCGGIAAYFNFDPIWLRILFALSFFFFGSGVLLYILLWMIIPKAKTTADKLEMKGETVNISNIEKSIREEIENLKNEYVGKTVDDQEKKNNSSLDSKQKSNNTLEDLGNFIINIFLFILKFISKFFVFILIAIGIVFFIVFMSSLMGSMAIITSFPLGSNLSWKNLTDILLIENSQLTMLGLGIFLFIGIPLIAGMYKGIKYLIGIKSKIKGLSFLAISFWLAGFGLMIFNGVKIANEFTEKTTINTLMNIPTPTNKTLYLQSLGKVNKNSKYRGHVSIGNWYFVSSSTQDSSFGSASLNIIKNNKNDFEIEVIQSANGKTNKDAKHTASKTNYTFTQKDSLIQFDKYFSIPNHTKWRNQKVDILVKVPIGGKVFIDRSMKKLIHDIENISGTSDHDMLGKTWKMTQEGLRSIEDY